MRGHCQGNCPKDAEAGSGAHQLRFTATRHGSTNHRADPQIRVRMLQPPGIPSPAVTQRSAGVASFSARIRSSGLVQRTCELTTHTHGCALCRRAECCDWRRLMDSGCGAFSGLVWIFIRVAGISDWDWHLGSDSARIIPVLSEGGRNHSAARRDDTADQGASSRRNRYPGWRSAPDERFRCGWGITWRRQPVAVVPAGWLFHAGRFSLTNTTGASQRISGPLLAGITAERFSSISHLAPTEAAQQARIPLFSSEILAQGLTGRA